MKHTIDYERILKTAYSGIRRSAAFMGLGVNAARDPKLKDYSLTKETTCQFLPHDLPDEKIAEIKSSFESWVIRKWVPRVDRNFCSFFG